MIKTRGETRPHLAARIEKATERFADAGFLSCRGQANEGGIYTFSYDPKYEMFVSDSFLKLARSPGHPSYNIVVCDLYDIFLSLCDERGILGRIPAMEKNFGPDRLREQLRVSVPPEMYVKKFAQYLEKSAGLANILLITGVGKAYPFVRVHNILNILEASGSELPKTPVVILYPGDYNMQEMRLFGEFPAANYYRATELVPDMDEKI